MKLFLFIWLHIYIDYVKNMHTKHMFFFNLTRQIRDKEKDVE